MTSYYEVSLEGVMEQADAKFRIVYSNLIFGEFEQPFLKFKNRTDAEQWLGILKKLQGDKGVFPSELKVVTNANGIKVEITYPIVPVITETAFYTQNELDQSALKKKWIKTKLSSEQLTDLGLTP